MSKRNRKNEGTPQYNNTSPRISKMVRNKNDEVFTESDFQDSERQMTNNLANGVQEFDQQQSMGGMKNISLIFGI